MLHLGKEQNLEVLRQVAVLLEAENKRLIERNLALTRELMALKGEDASCLQLRLQQLEEQLAQARQRLFGASTEKRPVEAAVSTAEPAPKPPQRGHGPRAQPALPLVEVVHVLEEADKACLQCGGVLTEMAGQFEESEEVDVVERRFVLTKHKRQKYRCRCNGCIETALGPTKLFPGARYSVAFAIDVAVQKYLDHLPLTRQVRIMGRENLLTESQTLWDYLDRLARLLSPAHEALHAYVLSQPLIGADETRWRMMGKNGKPGASWWQAWSVGTQDAICYRIEDSRSCEAARRVLGDYKGKLMVDGYTVYKSLAGKGWHFLLLHCWAHARRKFFDIRDSYPQVAAVLDLIGELYAVERLCPPGAEGDVLRLSLRQTRSREIVSRIHSWALAQRVLPESGLGKALTYLGGVWNGLVRFLEDARLPLDNNAIERAQRGLVVGRKNHYGSHSRRGTEVAALFYSLMESAKLVGLEPKHYLLLAVNAALRGEPIPLPHQLVAGAPKPPA